MNDPDISAVCANLASLNEIIAALVREVSDDEDFIAMTVQTLRKHSWSIGFVFEDEQPPVRRCADDGVCHHLCQSECFRVKCCGPLSGVFENDSWPSDALTAPFKQ